MEDIYKGRGDGQGQGGDGQGDGGADYCECPSCGHTEDHEKGTPCQEVACPECGAKMEGKNKKDSEKATKQFSLSVKITKANPFKRVVYGIVYAPDDPDAHDMYMSAETIEKMAWRWMLQSRQMDDGHNFIKGAGGPVESFIVRKNDPDFIFQKGHPKEGQTMEGAWVIGAKVFDEKVWKDVMKGAILSFSLAGVATYGKEKEMESQWYDKEGNKADPFK
jgi:hypothetical protein